MATSDANGKVRFPVPPGNYKVGPVTHPSYKPAPAQEVLGLADEEVRQVVFQLAKPLAVIEVSVVDSGGAPVAGADVPLEQV